MGTIGIPQKDYQDLLLAQADLLLCVGYDIVELAPSRLDPLLDKTIIHVSTAAAHMNRSYPPALEVVGDMAETLRHRRLNGHHPEYDHNLPQRVFHHNLFRRNQPGICEVTYGD